MSVAEHTTGDAGERDLHAEMITFGRAARDAATDLSQATTAAKNAALNAAAGALRDQRDGLLGANQRDLDEASELNAAMHERLVLTEDRIEAMACGLEDVAQLDDPIGSIIDSWERPNGLAISRVRVPLGVIGIIYESAPQRHCRRRRVVHQIWQRRDLARRIGKLSFVSRNSRLPGSRSRCCGAARGRGAIGADARSCSGGRAPAHERLC